MLENIAGYSLVLASASPRRNELMNGLGLKYRVKTLGEVDESYPEELDCLEVPHYIAAKKAEAFRASMGPHDLLITADTVVCKGGRVFGKPAGRDEALAMLRELSGGRHWVYTGVCLTSVRYQRSFTASTEVCFSVLDEAEIAWYVDRYQPYDKAGAYGIQEWIGFVGVEGISGSYFNVMGLPVHQLYLALKAFPRFTD